MEAPQIQEHLEPLVASTHEQLLVLQKYESTLSPENKAALKVGLSRAVALASKHSCNASAYLGVLTQPPMKS